MSSLILMLSGVGARVWAWAGAVAAVLAGLALVFRAGRKSAEVDRLREDLDTARRVRDAVDKSPGSPADLTDRLRRGGEL